VDGGRRTKSATRTLLPVGRCRAESCASLRRGGYSAQSAYTSGPRLLKVPAVNARVTELRQTVSTGAIIRAELDREFVLRELVDNALKAKQQGQWAASNRALELLGRELGLFSDDRADVVLPWNGDLDLLTDQQRDALVDLLLGMAVGHDPEKLAALKCHLMEQARAANNGNPYGRTNPTTLDHPAPVLIEGHVEQIANGHQREDPSSSAT